jgi:hypothetical protein
MDHQQVGVQRVDRQYQRGMIVGHHAHLQVAIARMPPEGDPVVGGQAQAFEHIVGGQLAGFGRPVIARHVIRQRRDVQVDKVRAGIGGGVDDGGGVVDAAVVRPGHFRHDHCGVAVAHDVLSDRHISHVRLLRQTL